MRISDWSSDVCSSDLLVEHPVAAMRGVDLAHPAAPDQAVDGKAADDGAFGKRAVRPARGGFERRRRRAVQYPRIARRSEQRPQLPANEVVLRRQPVPLRRGVELDQFDEPRLDMAPFGPARLPHKLTPPPDTYTRLVNPEHGGAGKDW